MSDNCPFKPGSSVVGYLRDSGGADQDLSTAQQEQKLILWCLDNAVTLAHIYIDAARPGESDEKRDAFHNMIDHFHDPNCRERGVILWTFSRFARNQNDSQYYKADLRRRGYVVHSINDNVPNTTDGRVFEALLDWMAEKFIEDLGRDAKRGIHHAAKEFGAIGGVPPVGFKMVKKNVGLRRDGSKHEVNTWVPDESLRPVILQAWKMRADGYPVRSIHEKLNLFSCKSTYSSFFRNRLYIGELVIGETTIPNYCEPIIQREVWDKVQYRNAINAKGLKSSELGIPNHPHRIGGTYLLSGIIFCKKCGRMLSGKSVDPIGMVKNEYYICPGKVNLRICDARAIPKIAIEKLIIDNLIEYIQDPQVMLNREQNRQKSATAQREEISAQLKTFTRKAAENKKHINHLVDSIADGKPAPASIFSRLQELENTLTAQELEITRLKSRLNPNNPQQVTSATTLELSDKLLAILASDNPRDKRAIIRLFIEHIDVEREDHLLKGISYFYTEFSEDEFPPQKKPMPVE